MERAMDSILAALLLFAETIEQVSDGVLPVEQLRAAMLNGFNCTKTE